MKTIVLIFTFVILSLKVCSQSCTCEPKTSINVCFLSHELICDGYSENGCGLTLDHWLIEGGLTQKLLNLDNFGPNGIADCEINLISFEEINDSEQLVNQNCNMFFVGTYSGDSITGAWSPDLTLMNENTLNAIYEWSSLCSQNLAIVLQEEAKRWGYNIENENANPNYPSNVQSEFLSIFDGPFGVINSFDQVGTYQGIITSSPTTGHTILGIDSNGKSTVVLDHLTNDIIQI